MAAEQMAGRPERQLEGSLVQPNDAELTTAAVTVATEINQKPSITRLS